MENLNRALFGKKDIHAMLTPIAVTTDHNARIFVADSNAQLIHVFNLQTRQYQAWKPHKKAPPFSQPIALAWVPNHNNLLVADAVAGSLFLFDNAGNFLGQLGQNILQRPVGIAVDPARSRLFVADTKAHQILVLSYSGELLNRIGSRGTAPGQFNFPTNLTLDKDGNLYVADTLNFRIQKFNPDLRHSATFGKKGDLPGYFAQPKAVALDSQDHLYVLDSQFENVQLFNQQAQVLMDFGEEGTGPGQFWLPTSIFINHTPDPNNPANRIYVADSYNKRIQIFDYLPAPDPKPEEQP
jgi:streptogramin lyase